MKTDSRRAADHLPVEISRTTKPSLGRSVKVNIKLTETHYRRSSIAQGGLEIPRVVVAKMNSYSVRNQMLLQNT